MRRAVIEKSHEFQHRCPASTNPCAWRRGGCGGDVPVCQPRCLVQIPRRPVPIVMVVWARYVVHTLLMAGIFLPKSGMNVLRTRRPLLQTCGP
jgi:hypothetical protein